jgi:eukaryotic-like serine/threonine-protein kinase
VDVPDETRLIQVATSISAGAPVDWAQVARDGDDDPETDVLREMHLLEQIANFHRGIEPLSKTPPPDADNTRQAPELRHWGHFAILEEIGRGSFGTVYRAWDNKLQCEVALKLLWPSGEHGPEDPARALREARLLARVRHNNVVTVHGTDDIDGRVGLWMEFVKGRTVGSLVRDNGPFGPREAALIGLDLCRALSAVHAAGLVHGDVKAHNVMRESGGRTVLMDFGTGKDLTRDELTGSAQMKDDFAGTPLYLPPEIFEGRPRTTSADLYSLGVLLYHLVTGAYPVDGRTRADIELAHQRQELKRLRDVRPDLPEDFIRAVERAIATEPRDRYQTAGAFETALAHSLGAPVVVVARHRRSAWMAIAALVTAFALTSVMYRAARRATEPPAPDAPPPSPAAVSANLAPAYEVDTALYRLLGRTRERLQSGARIAPGDKLFVEVQVSVPAYVYIVNEDDQGASFLLFPLPGQTITNPLPARTATRVPGARAGEDLYWQVTTAGGREHFLIFVSPERLTTFEQMFAGLPRAEVGKPVLNAKLSREAVGVLRGVGGLTSTAQPTSPDARLALQFQTPLRETVETASGLWVRQLTLDNPVK